jgi:peptidoglycan/LPS O-acetylase OafA/YrhL
MNARLPVRNAGIDLLRGLSIALVVIHHMALRISLKKSALSALVPKRALDALAFNGYEAVFIFFVISGFLIASNTLARWGSLSRISVKAFYLRRAARILPCLFILVGVLSALHLLGVKEYVITRANQSLPGAIFSGLGLHLNWYEGRTGYLPGSWDVLWSLSIEEVFYLIFPAVCLLLRRERILAPALALLAASLPVSRAALADNPIWQEKAYLPGMAAIAVGILTALAAVRVHLNRRRAAPWLCVMGAVGLGATMCFGNVLWPLIGNAYMLVLVVSCASLVLAFHWQAEDDAAWTFPGTGWLRSFGKLSYEIYLTHMFVVFGIVRLFAASGSNPQWGFLWHLAALPLSWLLGWLTARCVSTPCDVFLRRRWKLSEVRSA